MPSPGSGAAAKSPAKSSVPLESKLAKRKSQGFRSKIEGWNDAIVSAESESTSEGEEEPGGAPVGSSGETEAVAEKQAPNADETPAPKPPNAGPKGAGVKTPKGKKPARTIDLEKRAWVRRKSKPQQPVLSADIKKAVSPKKRVVSDGAWRRDRQAKKETAVATPESAEQKDTTPRPLTVRRSVASVGLKAPPSFRVFVEEADPEPARRRRLRTSPERSASASREQMTKTAATPDYESSRTKVYLKVRRKTDDAKTISTLSDSNLTGSSSIDRPSTATDLTSPNTSPGESSAKPRHRRSRNASGRRMSGSKSEGETGASPPGRNRHGKLHHDTDVLWKPSPQITEAARKAKLPQKEPKPPRPVPKVFGNRIDAWLGSVPDDPFTARCARSSTPEPSDPGRKRNTSQSGKHDSQDSRRQDRSKMRRDRPSLDSIDTGERSRHGEDTRKDVNEEDGSASPGTPSLKRSGARRVRHSSSRTDYTHHSPDSPDHSAVPSKLMRREATRYPAARARATAKIPAATPHGRPRLASASSGQITVIPDGSELSRASDGDEPMRHVTTLERRLTKHSDLMSVLSETRENDRHPRRAPSTRARRVRSDNATVGSLMNDVTTDELKYKRELRTLVDGVIPVLFSHVLSTQPENTANGTKAMPAKDGAAALTKPIVEMGVALERLKALHKRIPMHDANELLVWAQSAMKVYTDYLEVWRLGFQDVVVTLAPAEEDPLQPQSYGGKSTDPTDGESVEVAYLLKRPLVRLKNLHQTFRTLATVRPSVFSSDLAKGYSNLVARARQRANDEKARLEDETAASIDPTRARDPRTMAPLNGVRIDASRSVRARDIFDMQLWHSSGQQLDCKIEIIMRDASPHRRDRAGDVLFCEVSSAGRWLLFPPVLADHVSARGGDAVDELVVMVWGVERGGNEWREILSLTAAEGERQASEWLEMLPAKPAPPRLDRSSSFNAAKALRSVDPVRPPSPTESEYPIGERAKPDAKRWEANADGEDTSRKYTKPRRYRGRGPGEGVAVQPETSFSSDDWARPDPRSARDATYAHERYRPRTTHTRSQSEWTGTMTTASTSSIDRGYKVWMPSASSDMTYDDDESSDESEHFEPRRSSMRRRTSSVPSSKLPANPKSRNSEGVSGTPTSRHVAQQPQSAPAKAQKSGSRIDIQKNTRSTKRPVSTGLMSGKIPALKPASTNRRSSSPLKYEYEPSETSSSLTESSDESEFSDSDEDSDSVTSEFTGKDADALVSTVGELRDFSRPIQVRPASRQKPTTTSCEVDTVGPSDSASQVPFKKVPQPSVESPATKTVAGIFSWSDERGSWQNLHTQECAIVVSPGLVEAFDMVQAHAVAPSPDTPHKPSPSAHGVRPLVALELTPLVTLRRGTALDIAVRSPPIATSLLRNCGSNVMFRSRSPADTERLYAMFNRARIDNPTWIALQNARPRVSNWGESMDRRNAMRSSANLSWLKSLSRRSNSYRSKGTRSGSNAASSSSVGTMGTNTSAFSALKRFGAGGIGGSKIFNIAKSTITSREGTRSTNTGSDSLDSGGPGAPLDPRMGTPLGITNVKTRLYLRETTSKWQDLGAARVTIMLPPRRAPPEASAPPATPQEMLKRVLVTGKRHGEVLLDVELGESCFERVARTGIGVSVIDEQDEVASTGGVGGARTRVYMLQMKTEREAAYTFSMVGKLRY